MENQTYQVTEATSNGLPWAVHSVTVNRAPKAKAARPTPSVLEYTIDTETLPWQFNFHPFVWCNFYVGQDVEMDVDGVPTLLTYCGTNVEGHEGRYAFGKRV